MSQKRTKRTGRPFRSVLPSVTASQKLRILLLSSALLLLVSTIPSQPPSVSRHPLHFPQRRLDDTFIRYLSLGGPSTWGVGLEHPEPVVTSDGAMSVHESAYPYRLSPEVHNAAQREGGPTLAALCTQSIVHDQVYDVITIEFSNAYQSQDLVALALLAQRLRQRFPNALIVVVQLWSPSHYTQLETGMTFASWRQSLLVSQQHPHSQRNIGWDSNEWQSIALETEWVYSDAAKQATSHLEAIVDQINGKFVHLSPPSLASRALETANTWFVEVPTTTTTTTTTPSPMQQQQEEPFTYALSAKGHMVVANHIRSVVDQALVLKQPAEKRNTLGTWGSGDQCQLWYDSPANVVKFSNQLYLTRFVDNKYALEVPASGSGGGSIWVHNPFQEDRMLYLVYMTAALDDMTTMSRKDMGADKSRMYPRVQVQIRLREESTTSGDSTGTSAITKTSVLSGVIVDPYHDDTEDTRHVTRTTAIGKVPAETTVEVKIHPLQEAMFPFRLVGAVFLAKEKASLQIMTDYELEPEKVHVGRRFRRLRVW